MAGTELQTSHESRVHWWRAQFRRQRETNQSVTEFCRQLGISVTTFYYWKKRVHDVAPTVLGQVHCERSSHRMISTNGAVATFVPVSILEPATVTTLEIELTNACVVRFKGAIDPDLLQVAITAAGQLDGSRQGAD